MSHVKILCTGDLHLGRISSKCGSENDDAGLHSIRKAWERIVDLAIEREVDLLLLSGDIADSGSNQYEAMGPFEAGITRLANAERSIQVFLVVGNHDARTLPRLASLFADSSVRLLGRDGHWEQVEWPENGTPQVSLVGWSYPSGRSVAELPVGDLHIPPHPAVPIIALAHADYRTQSGDYTWVRETTLRGVAGVDMWLLGHIHAPEKLYGHPLILNPGSPQALDPGEPGCHGPWLVEIVDGNITAEQIPLSSVAYSSLTVDISAMKTDEDLAAYLLSELENVKKSYRSRNYAPRLSCRVTLTGRTGLLCELYKDRDNLLREQPLLESHNIYLEQLDLSGVRPDYDLSALYQQPDLIGTLARILTALEQPDGSEDIAAYLSMTREVISRVSNNPAFPEGVPRDDLPAPEALLKTECTRLLDILLRQEEARI